MPQMGYDMKEGAVVRWLKQPGDQVRRGESMAEIETDKAVVEMEAHASGVVRHILAQEGSTVPVGHTIAIIGAADEEIPGEWLEGAQAPAAPPEAPASAQVAAAPSEAAPSKAPPARGRVRASPLARRLAQEHGIDLGQLQGSGPRGRIVEEDVQAYLERGAGTEAPAPEPPTEEGQPQIVALSRMRQAIARLTTRAKQETPHFYVSADIHMDAAMALRQDLNQELEKRGTRITVNDLIVKACVLALQKHPSFNASYQDGQLRVHPRINIGIAVALEEGLIVPVVAGCDTKSLLELAQATREVAQRAQAGRLTEAEYTGGTFSISNLGMYDVDSFAAIIFPPQSAALAVGTVRKQAVVSDDRVEVAQVMKATLSVDHRVADGAQAAQFLGEIKRVLEHPAVLLL